MKKDRYIVLMAGGSGTRLYPASREKTPKHLSKLLGNQTLFQQTLHRALKIVPKENIYVSTNKNYVKEILKQSPQLTPTQIIAEPAKKNTAPAFTLATKLILEKNPQAIIAIFSCDHQILKENNFVNSINTGFEFITKNTNKILAVVLQPTTPHLGYEYVEKDGKISGEIYNVKRFIERPSTKNLAQKFVDSGYYWNASYYVFAGNIFLDEVKKYLPEIYFGIINNADYATLPEAQIDKAVMTKTDKLVLLPANWGWADIGSWESVLDLIEEKDKDDEENFSDGKFIGIDTHNTIVLSQTPEKLVATVGLNNVLVVTTNDAILIMERGRGQEVKLIVDELKKRKLEKYL